MARANEWRIRIVAGGVSWPGAYRGQGRMVSGGVMVAVVAVVAIGSYGREWHIKGNDLSQ